jgi:hypothetical protein
MAHRTKRARPTPSRGATPAAKSPTPSRYDDEAKLRNAAGQVYETERMDRISDDNIDQLQLDEMILNDTGERKHRKKILP